MKHLFLFTLLSVLFTSCFESDERVSPFPGQITTITDSVQSYQSWFDLESESVVSVNPVNEWALAFETSPGGWRIIVNSGADWFIYNTKVNTFPSAVNMPERFNGLFDNQQLWPDSTATGDWRKHDNTYLLARYRNGSFIDHKSVRFADYSDTSYIFYYNDGIRTDSVNIHKDSENTFSYYSFDKRSQVYPEPGKEAYDLLFTSYYDTPTLFGQTIPYKVGGVLLNHFNTMAVLDTLHNYGEIDIEMISGLEFSSQRDIPGFNWKEVVVDIAGGGIAMYSVRENYNYVIRTAQGNYFKLRFLSYTLDGRTGHPRFEFVKLN